jgi:hypothetical protein
MSKTDYNNHLVSAFNHVTSYKGKPEDLNNKFCLIEENCVIFTIQSGPVADFGRNGCDATDLIRFTVGLYKSFNNAFPCRENSIAITKLEEALHWQEARTRDRINRNVEGKNEE